MLDDPSSPAFRPPADDEETERIAAKFAARMGGGERGDDAPLTIGPYTHVRLHAHGGMGRVFLAYDPRLDRNVILKTLSVGITPDEPSAAVPVAEGKALAHLDHPHVVRVHEIIDYRGLPCVVLEHIEGLHLGDWLKAAPRTGADVLDKFLQAGEGLAAVHRAGLVHCDVKPSNVVVGEHGAVKLIDFGLAAAPGPRQPGALNFRAGTPRYMAPEQSDGAYVDQRADQFAFCVALFEALFDHHPYLSVEFESSVAGRASRLFDATSEQATRTHVIEQIRRGRLRPPERLPPGVAPTVLPALVRGLALDPAHRHPSMSALLVELRRDPRRTRRRALLGLAGGLAFTAGVYVTVTPDTCPDVQVETDRLWSDTRDDVAARLDQFGGGPLAALEGAARELAEARSGVCDAHVRSREAPTDAARDACLHTREAEFRATVQQIHASDDEQLSRLVGRLDDLPTAATCADPAHLRYSCAEDGESALSRSRAASARAAGDLTRADALARQAWSLAEGSGAIGSRASALVLRGRIAYDRGDWARAEELLRDAEDLAERSVCLSIAAEGYRWLVKTAAFDPRIPVARGEDDSRHQEYRITDGDRRAEADMLSDRGLLLERRRDEYSAAEALYRKAIARRADTPLDRTVAQADTYLNLASVLFATDRRDEARAALEASEERRTAAVGVRHPDHAKALRTLALLESDRGNYDQAIELIEQAIALTVAGLGADAPNLGELYLVLAQIHDRAGRRDQALTAAQEALRLFPREGLQYADALEAVAQMYTDADRFAAALDRLTLAERHLTTLGAGPARLGIVDFKIAEALNGLERPGEAEARASSALRRFDRAGLPADHDLRAHASLIHGEALLRLQRWSAATTPFERAVAIWQAHDNNPERLDWARWGLALALCRVPGRESEIPHVRAAAERSLALIETDPDKHSKEHQLLASICRPR